MAVAALANLMAGCTLNREAVRLAGGVPVLVQLLRAGPWKDITERATAALAELVHTSPDNQTAVLLFVLCSICISYIHNVRPQCCS